ncbi:hypothetical protein [Streptomyces sp. AC154]|uniref:hypothetical protein n=1 Tax=Streptomyces sp. AC154 TaxID=3143184 RepID=UPI003F7E89B1
MPLIDDRGVLTPVLPARTDSSSAFVTGDHVLTVALAIVPMPPPSTGEGSDETTKSVHVN